jgi:opacity protein-like surface antigen
MKFLGLGLVAALTIAAATSGAMAADLVVDEPAIVAATSHWDGAYAGIGVAVISSTTIAETIGAVQGSVGGNVTFDKFLLGAEAYLSVSQSSLGGAPYYAIGAEGRGGVLATDAVLLYGALGAEYVQGGNTYATVGGGAEFSVAENVSLDLEYKYYIGLNNTWQGHSLSLSANWHF